MTFRVIQGGGASPAAPGGSDESKVDGDVAEMQEAAAAFMGAIAGAVKAHLPDLTEGLDEETFGKLIERVFQEEVSLLGYTSTRHTPQENQQPFLGVALDDGTVFPAPREPETKNAALQLALVLALATSPPARAFLHLKGVKFSFVFAAPPKENKIIL